MKKVIFTIALAVILNISTIQGYADLAGQGNISAPGITISPVILNEEAGGNDYFPNTWDFNAENDSSSSLSFTITSAVGGKFNLNNISLNHEESAFNDAQEFPSFQLSISSPSLQNPLIYNIPYTYYIQPDQYDPFGSFSQIIGLTNISSATIDITIYTGAPGYGSPTVAISNIDIDTTSVPEPTSCAFALVSVVFFIYLRRHALRA